MTNIEYDEHKGRIAIGRLHAGELKKGMEVKVKFFNYENVYICADRHKYVYVPLHMLFNYHALNIEYNLRINTLLIP